MKKRIPNSYSAFPSSVNMRYGKRMSNGGAMNQLTEFNEGGRHEENGLGGIPQGMNNQGQMNLVEEGETKFNAENYIFSDTLKVDKELAKTFNLSPKMVGKTFAEASKLAGRKKSRREGDKIEEAANDADLMNLMEAQEAFKQKEIEERLAEIDALDPNALPAMMGQGQPQGDPTMGGQMQEAPMMDQEAMMAQQGGPSPEEMAMMQNQMMSQQEGMMRSGGKIPKSVLLSRAKSHMSDAAAQEYVKNYGSGGYMSRSYAPGGFMGMNMANANTFTDPCPCGTAGCPPCPGQETGFSRVKIGRTEQADDGLTDLQKAALEISPGRFKPTLTVEEKAKKKAQEDAINLAMDAPVGTDLKYTYLTEGNVRPFSDPRFKDVEVGIPMDTGYMNTNKLARQVSRNPTEFFYRADQSLEGDELKAARDRAEILNQARIDKYSINDSNLIANRGGGKLCYGCGGKMHVYGGRTMANGGNLAQGFGKVLDLAGNFLPGPFGMITDAASAAIGNIGTGASAKDVLKDVGTSLIPGALGAVGNYIGDSIPTDLEKMRDAAAASGNPIGGTDENNPEAANNLGQIGNQLGEVIESALNKEEEEESMNYQNQYALGGSMKSNYLRNGGRGLWANIRAKKERMGKNYRPAKPGDKDYPTEKAIKAAQQQMGGSLTNPTDPMNIEPLPLMPANQFGSPAQSTLPFNYAYNMQPTSIADFFQGENEINVDVDQEDVNRDFKFKETPMQAAAKALPIAANLYSGLFSKYDPKYEPEFVATEAPKLDYTESINAIRRSTAGLRKDLRKFGRNPGNLQVAAQKGAQLEAQAIQQVDAINAKLQFEAEKLNKAEKQKLERMKKQLMLTFDEAKRKSLQAASKQTKELMEANQANELAAYYATMAGEGIGSVEYKTLANQFADMLKNRNKNKKKK